MPRLLRDLHNGDLLAVLAQPLELDLAVLEGEQGVVAALAHVDAGVNMGCLLYTSDAADE